MVTPSPPQRRVLAIGAHPDDLETLCGGTLRRYVLDGHEVVMCHVASGNRGSFVHDAEELARIRCEEARRAAEIAGATHMTLGLTDTEIDASNREHRERVIDLIREVRPDVIITHGPDDYHGDHNQVSRLVFECSFHATLPLVRTRHPHHDLVAPIYFMDNVAGLGFIPTEYVDVSDVIDVKRAMLAAHESQLPWLLEHDGIDLVEDVVTMARFRGYQCGVRYAEGFRPCLTAFRGTTRRLLP